MSQVPVFWSSISYITFHAVEVTPEILPTLGSHFRSKNTQGPRKILRNKYLPQGNFFIHSWVPPRKAECTFHYFRKLQLTETELGLSHVCQGGVQRKQFSVSTFPGFPQNLGAQCKAVIQGEWHLCDSSWVHILPGLPYPFQGLGPRIQSYQWHCLQYFSSPLPSTIAGS